LQQPPRADVPGTAALFLAPRGQKEGSPDIFARMDEEAACIAGGLFHFRQDVFPPAAYQACERNHRHAPRPTCHATGLLFQEILAVPVIPSRSDPSVLGKTITTAK
jgi:hypothetical protein